MFQRLVSPLGVNLRSFSNIAGDNIVATDGLTLNHFQSKCGVGSRRKCADFVASGRVRVNGELITHPGLRVGTSDRITMDGDLISLVETFVTVMIHKPAGLECTRPTIYCNYEDTVYSLLDETKAPFHLIGRLDKNTSGLLLATTDGELAQRIAHPSFNVPKEYRVTAQKPLTEEDIQQMLIGCEDEGELLKFDLITHQQNTNYNVVLRTGRKREVRRLFKCVGNYVYQLKRLRVGGLKLDKLPLGQVKQLTPTDLRSLFTYPAEQEKNTQNTHYEDE